MTNSRAFYTVYVFFFWAVKLTLMFCLIQNITNSFKNIVGHIFFSKLSFRHTLSLWTFCTNKSRQRRERMYLSHALHYWYIHIPCNPLSFGFSLFSWLKSLNFIQHNIKLCDLSCQCNLTKKKRTIDFWKIMKITPSIPKLLLL